MVSSVTHENHMPYRRTTVASWLLMAVNAVSFWLQGKPLMNEYWMMLAICVTAWSVLAHFVYYVLLDFSRILDINVFTIKHKKVDSDTPAADQPSTRSGSHDKILNSKKNIPPRKAVKNNN